MSLEHLHALVQEAIRDYVEAAKAEGLEAYEDALCELGTDLYDYEKDYRRMTVAALAVKERRAKAFIAEALKEEAKVNDP